MPSTDRLSSTVVEADTVTHYHTFELSEAQGRREGRIVGARGVEDTRRTRPTESGYLGAHRH